MLRYLELVIAVAIFVKTLDYQLRRLPPACMLSSDQIFQQVCLRQSNYVFVRLITVGAVSTAKGEAKKDAPATTDKPATKEDKTAPSPGTPAKPESKTKKKAAE